MTMLLLLLAVGLVPTLRAQADTCVPTNLTVTEKLELNAEANDHDNNHVVDYSDVVHDMDNNYDRNDDGKVTEAEWVQRWTCAFGDTEFYARFVYAVLSGGADSVSDSDFNVPPFNTTGLRLRDFVEMNRQRYERFSSHQCVNTQLTVDEKVARAAKDNDHDGDGLVTTADITYDMSNHYDTDNDGLVTEAEWVVRWVCAYGDTVAFAAYVWDHLTGGQVDHVSTTQFTDEPFASGWPIEAFKAANRKRYVDYASGSPVGK